MRKEKTNQPTIVFGHKAETGNEYRHFFCGVSLYIKIGLTAARRTPDFEEADVVNLENKMTS